MSFPAPHAADRPARAVPASAAQQRIIDAAGELFAERGVGGTSLQMIADAIGVTKAAVYHHFKAKEEIVVSVATGELARLEAAIEDAEAQPTPAQARDMLISRIVDLAVERRRMESTLLGDPVIVRFFTHDDRYRAQLFRLARRFLDLPD